MTPTGARRSVGLTAAPAASDAESAACQQQDEENDDEDCEHVTSQRLRLGSLGCTCVLLVFVAGEGVEDRVDLIVDRRLGLVGPALVPPVPA